MTVRCAHAKVALGVLGLALGGCEDPTPEQRLTEFSMQVEMVPVWPAPADPATHDPAPADPAPLVEPSAPTEVLDIYLDVSRPMGGFLAPGDDPPSGEFRTVVQWVPDHLLRAYRHEAVPLTWRDVGAVVGPRASPPLPGIFERSRFDARSSRLDLALETMLDDVRTGRADAGALITDLVGTGESTGALALSKPVKDWLRSPDVRSGKLHLGLLGAKATYWGAAHPTVCPLRDGLGCRFSERLNRYVRLEQPAAVPFYVLLAGSGAARVSQVGESIRDDAAEQGVEALWELLTAESRTRPARGTCKALRDDGKEQYALFVDAADDQRRYRCRRDESVRLACEFDGGANPVGAVVADPHPAFEAKVADGRIVVVEIDCAALRDRPDLPTLHLTVSAAAAAARDLPPWEDWSTTTDETDDSIGRTLQLKYFVEDARLRPDGYRIELPLLRGAGTP